MNHPVIMVEDKFILKSPFRCGKLDITAYQGHRLSLVYRDGHCKPVDTNLLSLFDGFVDDRLW